MAITALVNSYELPPIEQEFLRTPIENAADVQTLSGEIYTDFISLEQGWSFSYASLTQAQYDAIKTIYDSQFSAPYQYPLLTISEYGITDAPARMTLNEQDIWNHCGDVQNIKIIFRLTEQLAETS